MKTKTAYAYLDFCFYEKCNLACTYCRPSDEKMRDAADFSRIQAGVDSFLQHSTAAVLKVSGYGEVSLWPHLVEFLDRYRGAFPAMQVISNGTMAPNLLEKLCRFENITFCTTIDGHRLEANRHRSHLKSNLHEKMLRFVHLVNEQGKPIEINCVLTGANLDSFIDFARYINHHFGTQSMIMPFPVRPFVGIENTGLFPSNEQVVRFSREIDAHYHEFEQVLPPREYFHRLVDFLKHMKRGCRCTAAAFNYGVNPLLNTLLCACSGHSVPSENKKNIVDGNQPDASSGPLIDKTRLRIDAYKQGRVDRRCSTCFTHYDVINLYIDGKIGLHDIRNIPAFTPPGTAELLETVKNQLVLDRE